VADTSKLAFGSQLNHSNLTGRYAELGSHILVFNLGILNEQAEYL